MSSKHLRILYWSATLLFAVPQALSALHCLFGGPAMQAIAALGYPVYFMKMLAMAKLLGIVAIVYSRWPVLKEWAYAGFTFEASAALLSLLHTGGAPGIVALSLAFLVVQLVSYRSWARLEARGESSFKARRRVRVLLPALR